jgi:hypothetical protein
VNVVGAERMQPPIRDLLPRLTPILRNRHEAVQENVVDLVGRIADRGGKFVVAKEWLRVTYELLELLKAHRKGIRRAAVSTFGYIARVIGPSDVLVTLLNNLKVQDRNNRICTTVAIAIVAEQCAPFTVLPGLMNEYKIPDLNVQNGVLKALSFMMEYIQQMAGDYINAVTPLLEDALIDRDAVHRQTACSIVKHIAIGVHGLGCEDCLTHLLNFVWPNVFETSPHVIGAVCDAIEVSRKTADCFGSTNIEIFPGYCTRNWSCSSSQFLFGWFVSSCTQSADDLLEDLQHSAVQLSGQDGCVLSDSTKRGGKKVRAKRARLDVVKGKDETRSKERIREGWSCVDLLEWIKLVMREMEEHQTLTVKDCAIAKAIFAHSWD